MKDYYTHFECHADPIVVRVDPIHPLKYRECDIRVATEG